MRNALLAAVCMLVFTTNGQPGRVLDPEVARLPRCVMGGAAWPDAEWMRVTAPRKDVRLRIPPELVAAPEPSYMHGGYTWGDGERRVQLLYGHWGPFSLREARKKCLWRMPRIDAVIVDRERDGWLSISVWLVGSGKGQRPGYDVLLTMNSPRPSDRAVLLTMVRSASR